jgi:hypothetical protein
MLHYFDGIAGGICKVEKDCISPVLIAARRNPGIGGVCSCKVGREFRVAGDQPVTELYFIDVQLRFLGVA